MSREKKEKPTHAACRLLPTLLLLLGCLLPDFASGAMIGYSAQLQTNMNSFSISNTSDAGFTITGLDIDLGDGAQFDTSLLNLDSVSDLTFSPTLALAVLDAASGAEFQFTGFDVGESFGFNTLFVNGTGATAAGSDLDNALITVTFSNGLVLSTTFSGGPTSPPTSNRQAFMFNASATIDPVIAETPAPASAWLLLAGLGGLGLVQCGRRVMIR